MSELGSFDNPVKFKDQDYDVLLQKCLKSAVLFSDAVFAANQSSLGIPVDPDPKKAVKWLRPKEITSNAVFVEGTMGTTDICQGQLGNCWLLAALSCLTMHPTLFVKVVPSGQSLSESYAGIFRFRRVHLDKACTKASHYSSRGLCDVVLIGSYGSLKGGIISEGMEDFTGGIAYSLHVSSRPPRMLWRAITASLARSSLLSCFIQAASVKEIGTVTSEGLIKGHAYAITDTDKVQKASEEVLLLRLRNPWGFVEYCGPWSDKCQDWDFIDNAQKARLELAKVEDGEFWIGIEDFSRLFNTVEMCSVNPDSMSGEASDDTATPSWTLSSHQGTWVPMCSAGGSRRYPRSFWKNPQFQVILSEKDVDDYDYGEDEEGEEGDGEDDEEGVVVAPMSKTEKQGEKKKCTVLVELLQKYRRQKDKVHFLYIAFHIYKVPPELQDKPGSLDQQFFSNNRPVARSGKYRSIRSVWRKVHLEPGSYVIVASTYRPNQQGEFFLRVYTKTGNIQGFQDFPCINNYSVMVMSKPVLPEDLFRVQKWFDEKAGSDDRVNAVQFMDLVNSVLEKDYELPLETCRQLIFGEDTGGRGRLNRAQAEKLLTSLRNLQSVFFQFDEDSSGTMSPFELSLALNAAGVECDNVVVQLLWERFGAGEQYLPFCGFVSCVARLQVLFDLFESETNPELKDKGINAWLLKLLAV
ncbi:calpain-1 catalytic subunit-like [Sinocyclocheilus rhinocerous]|uniref:calpain-1 catalytic subunit-like n=1 Tax=Sinocyclocheilus rhinocerous TaxID=307959 RepID=UPI0007BA0D74|nr:PREDICTED: calpain-1 catalytic subunit-like [Sinocyclocheilus rhinocerous]